MAAIHRGSRDNHRIPLPHEGLLLRTSLRRGAILRHAERAVHPADAGVDDLRHGRPRHQGRRPERLGQHGNLQLDNEYGLLYKFANGVPISLEQHALPFTTHSTLNAELGIYAQDRWTFKRATINAGLRFDYFSNGFPDQHLGPASFVPHRDFTIPASTYASLKDITPRLGVASRSLWHREDIAQEQLREVHAGTQPRRRQSDLVALDHGQP